MAKVKDVLIHVSVEVAVKKRKCHRSGGKHGIGAGEKCLAIKDGLNRRNYCADCAALILGLAAKRLAEMSQAMSHRTHA